MDAREAFMNIPMSKEISCQNFKGLVAYLRKHYGDEGVEQLVAGLVDGDYFIQDKYDPTLIVPITVEHLKDGAYWVSNEFSLMLLSNVRKIMGGPNPLFTVGAEMVRESLSKTTLFVIKSLSPEMLVKQAPKLNAKFNRTKDVHLVAASGSSAEFEIKYRPGFNVTKDVCNWNLGVYTGIAELTGATIVEIRELECVVEGAPCCRFFIKWKKRSILSHWLRATINRMIGWAMKDLIADYETIIEERDRLVENLTKSESKYRTLFEESLEAMCLSCNGELIDANPAWLKMHGFSEKGEIIGKNEFDTVHPGDQNLLIANRQAWAKNHRQRIQLRHIRKDGKPIDVEVNSSRVEFDGKESILDTVRDVTELKKAEDERRRLEAKIQKTERMESVAALAVGVARDLGAILNGLSGYPDSILRQLPDESPLVAPVHAIRESGEKAAAIVEDLLALTRRGIARRDVLNLNAIVNDFLESPEYRQLKSSNQKLETSRDLAPDLLNLEGSSTHLTKVLGNIVANSTKAMPGGGTLTIRTANRYIDKELQGFDRVPEGEYCVLTVADTGVGISAQDIDNVFEPFYAKNRTGGRLTGLGMAVVWATVKDHNGFIHLDSEVGKGTYIQLFFPATRKAIPGGAGVQDLTQLNGNGEKILIVDDVKKQRDIAAEMLETLGYDVSAVIRGEDAVKFLKMARFDLVVIDMVMDPGIDGLETYRRIIREKPDQKAMIVSGFSETERIRQALKIGVGAVVKKPYTIEKFGLAVKRELSKPSHTEDDAGPS